MLHRTPWPRWGRGCDGGGPRSVVGGDVAGGGGAGGGGGRGAGGAGGGGAVDGEAAAVGQHVLGIGVAEVHVEHHHGRRVVDRQRAKDGGALVVAVAGAVGRVGRVAEDGRLGPAE